MQIQLLLNYGKSILFNKIHTSIHSKIHSEKRNISFLLTKSEESNLKPDEIFSLQSKHLNLKLTNESVHLPTQVFLITKNESSALTNRGERIPSTAMSGVILFRLLEPAGSEPTLNQRTQIEHYTGDRLV